MVLNVTPRRTVGISGFDVGSVAWRRGMGQTDFSSLVDPSGTGGGSIDTSGGSTISDTTEAINFSDLFGSFTAPSASSSGSGSSSGGGIDWTKLFAPLTQAAGAIGSGYAASLLKTGQSLSTSGTVVTGAGTTLPGSGVLASATSSLSGYLPLLLIAGVGILAISMMKK